LTIGVECARRGWGFVDLVRRLNADGETLSRISMDQRVDKDVPTRQTIELVGKAFGYSFEAMLDMMVQETEAALKQGHLVDDKVTFVDPYVTTEYWRHEHHETV